MTRHIFQIRAEEQSVKESHFTSLQEEIHYVTHEIHNKKSKDGRINRFDPKTGIYSANSVSPHADNFLQLNIEEGIKPVVQALLNKGYYTYSSCAGHCLSDRRFVGIAFPNQIMKIRFLAQTKTWVEKGVIFRELDTVINQKSSVTNHDLKSTPLGEAGQRFVSCSEETEVFNIQFHCDAARFYFVEMIILEGSDTCSLMSSPMRAVRLLMTKLFRRDQTTIGLANFIANDLTP
jgi:hypothetical protein